MSSPYLSVIIPAYNESARIGKTISSLASYFADKDYEYEIIVVDDGSTDTTAKMVYAAFDKLPGLRLIQNQINRGKGYSVHAGMLSAKGKFRLFMDADNSVDIRHLEDFMEWMKKGYDVVIGSIALREADVKEGAGFHRRALGYVAKKLIGFLAVPGIKDTQRGFKLFSAMAAELTFSQQTIERFGFDIEILVIAWLNGYKIKELPVTWNNPAGSTVTLRSYLQTFNELIYILINRARGLYTRTPVTVRRS